MSKHNRLDLPDVSLADEGLQALYDAIRDALLFSDRPPLDYLADDTYTVADLPEVGEEYLAGLTTPEELADFVETHRSAIEHVFESEGVGQLPAEEAAANVRLVQTAITWACYGGIAWLEVYSEDDDY